MIRKSFKNIVALFSVILCMFATCVFAACNSDDKSIELVEFGDIEVKCPIHTEFSFAPYLVTLDENGNRYVGTATVTDEENNPVEAAFYRFEVSSMQKYTVVISVEVSENDVRKRKISVVAADMSVPVITFLSEPYRGMGGVEYVLPVVKAEKKEGEELTPVITVVFVDGDNEIEQQINGDKFTPVLGGTYRIIVTVTDANGTTVKITRDFLVEESANSPRDPAREDIY